MNKLDEAERTRERFDKKYRGRTVIARESCVEKKAGRRMKRQNGKEYKAQTQKDEDETRRAGSRSNS